MINRIKIVLVCLLYLLVISCGSKKKVSEKTVDIQRDSTNTTIQLSTNNVLTIETLCDSLGNVKTFSNVIKNGSSSTIVGVKDNKLTVEVLNAPIQYKDTSKIKQSEIIKTIDIYKTPKWAWYYMIIVTILALVGFKVWRLF